MAEEAVAMDTQKENGSTPSDKGDHRTSSSECGGAGTKCIRPDARTAWSVTAVRGKVTDRCLWTACKAMTAGLFLIIIGAGMATLGFYSGHLSTVEEQRGNTTVWVKNESRDSHLGSLTYLGPVVMGIGGFTIVAACVMTFEARDTAAKIVPVWFRRTRIHAVSGNGSTPSGRSSKTSWERFLAQHRPSEDAEESRSAVTQALINFSKYLQGSVESGKIPTQVTQNSLLRKCPSEPNFPKIYAPKKTSLALPPPPESVALLKSTTPQPPAHPPLLVVDRTKPMTLTAALSVYRQAVSMDCPRPPMLQHQGTRDSQTDSQGGSSSQTTSQEPITVLQATPSQASCTDSTGSLSVDIYLPQGSVTVKVRDETKDAKPRRSVSEESEKDEEDTEYISPSSDETETSQESSLEETESVTIPIIREPEEEQSSKESFSESPLLRHPTRKDSTIKRHPLLRQAALDTFADATPEASEESV